MGIYKPDHDQVAVLLWVLEDVEGLPEHSSYIYYRALQ